MFSHFIDASSSHPDTIVTHWRTCRGRFLMGMTYVQLSVDMELCIYTQNKISSNSRPCHLHLQICLYLDSSILTTLWKAGNRQSPPDASIEIIDFGGKIQDGVQVSVVGERERDPAPPQLSDVIIWQCKAVWKRCTIVACEHISCTTYCGEDAATRMQR